MEPRLPSSSSSSSSFNYPISSSTSRSEIQILKLTIEDARIFEEGRKEMEVYAEVYISPDKKLKTKVSKTEDLIFTPSDSFVFEVRNDRLSDPNSIVTIAIYELRWGFMKVLVGRANCSLQILLRAQERDCQEEEPRQLKRAVPLELTKSRPNESCGTVRVLMEVLDSKMSIIGRGRESNSAMKRKDLNNIYAPLVGDKEDIGNNRRKGKSVWQCFYWK